MNTIDHSDSTDQAEARASDRTDLAGGSDLAEAPVSDRTGGSGGSDPAEARASDRTDGTGGSDSTPSHVTDALHEPDATGGSIAWTEADLLDAALSARRAGVGADEARDSFGAGATRLASLAESLVTGGPAPAPEPRASFSRGLELSVAEAFDARPVPGARAPFRLGRTRIRRHAAAVAVVAVVASVAAVLFVSSPARAPGGAPTAIAATGTATDATPEARATLGAQAGATQPGATQPVAAQAGAPERTGSRGPVTRLEAERAIRAHRAAPAGAFLEAGSSITREIWRGEPTPGRSHMAGPVPTTAPAGGGVVHAPGMPGTRLTHAGCDVAHLAADPAAAPPAEGATERWRVLA